MSLFSGNPDTLIRVDVEPIMIDGRQKATDKGTWYRAKLNGEVIIEQTLEPFYNLARTLQKLGYSGQYGIWVDNKFRLAGQVERNAKMAIQESDRGFTLTKYKEFEGIGDD